MNTDKEKKEKPADTEERLLDLKEVGERLGVSVRTVWRMIAAGELPRPVRVRRAPRLLLSEIGAYIERIKRQRTQVTGNL